jgi:hypothetical protein
MVTLFVAVFVVDKIFGVSIVAFVCSVKALPDARGSFFVETEFVLDIPTGGIQGKEQGEIEIECGGQVEITLFELVEGLSLIGVPTSEEGNTANGKVRPDEMGYVYFHVLLVPVDEPSTDNCGYNEGDPEEDSGCLDELGKYQAVEEEAKEETTNGTKCGHLNFLGNMSNITHDTGGGESKDSANDGEENSLS